MAIFDAPEVSDKEIEEHEGRFNGEYQDSKFSIFIELLIAMWLMWLLINEFFDIVIQLIIKYLLAHGHHLIGE